MAAKKDTIEIYESRRNPGQYGWRYKTKNGKKVACSGELYTKEVHAKMMVGQLFHYQLANGVTEVLDLTPNRKR